MLQGKKDLRPGSQEPMESACDYSARQQRINDVTPAFVHETRAFTPQRLRQQKRRTTGQAQGCRMELDELEVGQARTSLPGEIQTRAAGFGRIGRAAPQRSIATG